MGRRVLMVVVSGGRVSGRPRLGLIKSVKVALDSRGMAVETVLQCAKDRKELGALVHMWMIEIHVAICAFTFQNAEPITCQNVIILSCLK